MYTHKYRTVLQVLLLIIIFFCFFNNRDKDITRWERGGVIGDAGSCISVNSFARQPNKTRTRPSNERIPSSSLLSSHLAPIDSLHKKKSKKGCHVRPHSWKTSFRDLKVNKGSKYIIFQFFFAVQLNDFWKKDDCRIIK